MGSESSGPKVPNPGVAESAAMLVAGPNLALDRVVRLERLRPGEVNRFRDACAVPGGKGVNVCRAAGRLGTRSVLVGLVPGRTGRAAAELAKAEGIELRAVECEGEIRVATIVLEDHGRVTVLNEPGPPANLVTWRRYVETLRAENSTNGPLVCTGSLPREAPEDAYAELVEMGHRTGRKVIVDASGPPLAAVLPARPDVVIPNLPEAEEALGQGGGQPVASGPRARHRAEAAARRLVAAGAGAAIVTAGEAGAALAGPFGEVWLGAPPARLVNPVGAGDCFAAGLAAGLEAGAPLPDAARRGMAAAAAGVEDPIPGRFDVARYRDLLAELG